MADYQKLKRKAVLMFGGTVVFFAAIFSLTAGSFRFWQGWVFSGIILAVALVVTIYFLKRSPDFLERRMKFKEKELKQKTIIKISNALFFLGFLIPGLDFRYGWSAVPVWLVLAADAAVLGSYVIVFLAFKENEFAGRTVEVFAGQRVIDTGPYAVVRHPMYAGVLPMILCMPLALGSYWALIPMLPVCAVLIARIFNEEEVLRRDLPGYSAYCAKVRYRLIPFVW